MKERNQALAAKIIPGFRKRIDALDVELLKLVGERFDIMREVAKIKHKNGVAAFLPDRVNEVRDNAMRHGRKYGIPPHFVQAMYTLMIYESCALEDVLMAKKKATKKAPAKAVKKKPAQKKPAKKKSIRK